MSRVIKRQCIVKGCVDLRTGDKKKCFFHHNQSVVRKNLYLVEKETKCPPCTTTK